MGHYYDCLKCGEERCRCPGPPSRYDDEFFTDIVSTIKIGCVEKTDIYALLARHTHYPDAFQPQLAIIERGLHVNSSLIKSQRCPIDVIVTIANRLATSQFSSGIARVNGPFYRKMREPRAASQVIGLLFKRLGFTLAETRYGISNAAGSSTIKEFFFLGHNSTQSHDALTQLQESLLSLSRKMVSDYKMGGA